MVGGGSSDPFFPQSGIRQGCPLSPLLFLFVQEVFLHMIRTDSDLKGVRIPGPQGSDALGEATELTVRSLADDIVVYLEDASHVQRLMEIAESFRRISNHTINGSKSWAILVGGQVWREAHLGTGTERDPKVICKGCCSG